MDNNIKKIIKIVCLILSLTLITLLCILLMNFNNAKIEEMNTPVHIVPSFKKDVPKTTDPQKPQKPLTRDENNMPKSDYKVPEIG